MNVYYYTKDQLLKVFAGWGVNEPPPNRNKKVLVAFPRPTVLNLAAVTRHHVKSTYGKLLYRVALTHHD